jgi:hypothetical protein
MHSLESSLPLLFAIAALCAGPLLYRAAARSGGATLALHALVGVGVLAIVLFEVLPECVESAGWVALVVASGGLVVPFVAERGLDARASGALRSAFVASAVVALLLHSLVEGLALAAAGHSHHHHEHGGLAGAILLHRLPEGAAVWWLARPLGRGFGIAAFATLCATTVLGFALGGVAHHAFEGGAFALFQAFVSGLLLHVLWHRHGHVHAPRARHAE